MTEFPECQSKVTSAPACAEPVEQRLLRRGQDRPASAAILLLHHRKVATLFPDGEGETVPSGVEGVHYPFTLCGLLRWEWFTPTAKPEDLSTVCEQLGPVGVRRFCRTLSFARMDLLLFIPIAVFW